MSCETLLMRMGYECHESEGTLIVDTPFCFPDGETISFFLAEERGSFLLHDNAGTLAHLMGIGIDLTDRRKWKALRNILTHHGFTMHDNGIIAAEVRKGEEAKFIADYVGGLLAITDYERELLGLTEEQSDFIAEVEMGLRKWKPFAPIEPNPSVRGHSGRVHQFHFDWDGKLVEASQPHGSRTGKILRKAADVRNEIERPILVVMDDRDDPERASIESDILTNMVSVMKFSDLLKHASESTQH